MTDLQQQILETFRTRMAGEAADCMSYMRFELGWNYTKCMSVVQGAGVEPAAWDQLVMEGEQQ